MDYGPSWRQRPCSFIHLCTSSFYSSFKFNKWWDSTCKARLYGKYSSFLCFGEYYLIYTLTEKQTEHVDKKSVEQSTKWRLDMRTFFIYPEAEAMENLLGTVMINHLMLTQLCITSKIMNKTLAFILFNEPLHLLLCLFPQWLWNWQDSYCWGGNKFTRDRLADMTMGFLTLQIKNLQVRETGSQDCPRK